MKSEEELTTKQKIIIAVTWIITWTVATIIGYGIISFVKYVSSDLFPGITYYATLITLIALIVSLLENTIVAWARNRVKNWVGERNAKKKGDG